MTGTSSMGRLRKFNKTFPIHIVNEQKVCQPSILITKSQEILTLGARSSLLPVMLVMKAKMTLPNPLRRECCLMERQSCAVDCRKFH